NRRNALFYKTLNGAGVGDLFMSFIHTCELNGANPFDYLAGLPVTLAADERRHSRGRGFERLFECIVEKGNPHFRRISSARHTREVASHASFGDDEAEFLKLTVDPGRPPCRILPRQAADQAAKLIANLRSVGTTLSPPPMPAEDCPVPRDYGVRFDDDEHIPPAGPEFV
ncbi:MAG: hypothetical protein ABIZ80_06590, partial [Bryobacteraceae bacterium]